jgi:hypothetical protein
MLGRKISRNNCVCDKKDTFTSNADSFKERKPQNHKIIFNVNIPLGHLMVWKT